jgi:hypothetical protein
VLALGAKTSAPGDGRKAGNPPSPCGAYHVAPAPHRNRRTSLQSNEQGRFRHAEHRAASEACIGIGRARRDSSNGGDGGLEVSIGHGGGGWRVRIFF